MEKKESHWNELDYYREGQPIYGRDEDIRKISNSICQNLQTTLYGQSGIGKSSLLFAGIFPVLRKYNYFPVFIRLGLVPKDESYVDFVKKTIINEAQKVNHSIGKVFIEPKAIQTSTNRQPEIPDSERLWQFFCYTEFLNQSGEAFIPVLVFDQFEEILNNKDTYQKAKQFLLDIYSLLDDTRIQPENGITYSNYRIVFSLREDYLYCLEDIIDYYNLTELRFNRYRIRALSKIQAKEVIIKTADGDIEKGLEQEICERIIAESQNYMGEVNTLMLSLVCSTISLNSVDGVIRLEAINNNSDYLYYYYESKLSVVSAKTKKYLEEVLVTNDGRRDSIDIKTAIESGKILQEEVDLLVDNRIVRVLSSSEGGNRMEFIHDKITSIINTKRQTYWQCLKNAFGNMFNMNSRANVKEYRTIEYSYFFFFLICLLFVVLGNHFGLRWIKVISLNLFIGFSYIVTTTTIRRGHDRNISGWDALSDGMKNRVKPSASSMYSTGSSAIMAARRVHPFNTMSREEFVAAHKYFIFFAIWVILLIIPYILIDKDIFLLLVMIVHEGFYFACLSLVFLRLPAMGLSPWLGIIPIVPWFYCFRKVKQEKYYELNIAKASKRYIVIFFLLYIIFMVIAFYFA